MPTTRHQIPPVSTDVVNRSITRCAVCKVDLKGRFVFVDDQARELFGCPCEDLFGKPIVDFVDESSRSIINEILSRRNHYEITFDHISLSLVNPDNTTVRTGAIVTLNFNAGNPVNFQFVFINDSAVSIDPVHDPHAAAYRRLAAYLDGRDITADWRSYLREIHAFTGALQVCAYLISPDRLEHRSSAVDTGDGVSSLPSIDPVGPLHNQVAEMGETYDFTDQRSIQRAVEFGIPAPNEVAARVTFTDDQAVLVRVIFPADLDDPTAHVRADRARFALELTQRFVASPPRSSGDRDAENIQFTIGLLDGLGIGAFMVDSRGKVAIYNPALADLLQLQDIALDLTELAALLSGGSADTERRLRNSLNTATHPSDSAPELLRVELPSGRSGILACFPLAENPDDHTSFLVVVPNALAADTSDVLSFSRVVMHRLKTQVDSAAELSGELGRKYCNVVDSDGNARLTRLNISLQDLGRLMHDLQSILEIAGTPSPPEFTDLNVVLHRITNHVNRGRANQPLRVHSEVMPKISTCRRAVTAALEHLLGAVADVVDCATATVRVSAELTDPSSCRLTITVGASLDRDNPAFAAGSYTARLLVRSIGGTVEGKTRKDHTTLILTFPVQP